MFLDRYSLGIGDRFGQQGKAQLRALRQAKDKGVSIIPVWNKSHREHSIVGTVPEDVRIEADESVKSLGWNLPYYVDADHVGLDNVDWFLDSSDYFTLDVADSVGQPVGYDDLQTFIDQYKRYIGALNMPGLNEPLNVTEILIRSTADKFLSAVREAGRIYRHIEDAKGADNFITEVSMDETDKPQTPVEMLFILAAIADEGLPAQAIAPRFIGRFNKGVDYDGDVDRFALEFERHLAVIDFAIEEFGLPDNLKISIHSGSDKFSIYPSINQAIKKRDGGLHLKTAGTTWLEELIGLAIAGGDGLEIANEIYREALDRFDELCEPYSAVLAIHKKRLPSPETVEGWNGREFADSLRHDPACEMYNPAFRQMLHVGYKLAAEMGDRYLNSLNEYEDVIGESVTENLFERHIQPVFLDGS